eukprot:4128454-Amphidinium_carterae.1
MCQPELGGHPYHIYSFAKGQFDRVTCRFRLPKLWRSDVDTCCTNTTSDMWKEGTEQFNCPHSIRANKCVGQPNTQQHF